MPILASGEGTDTSSLNGVPFQDNVVYEHRIECVVLPELVDFFNNMQNTLEQNGAELLSKTTQGNTIVYQFRKMTPQQITAKGLNFNPNFVVPAFIVTVIWAVIALIVVALVLRWTLATLIVPAAFDVMKLAIIGLAVVGVIVVAAVLLRKGKVIGDKPIFGKDKKGEAKSDVKRRIIEEY